MSGSDPIRPFDLQRLFLGDAPPLFLLEIAFRTGVIFLWLLVLLRLTGKRGLAQLSPLELAIVIALGSAAGDPMFYPEVPLLHAMLVLALVVLMQAGLSKLVQRSERVEGFVEGQPVELVRDGVMSLSALAHASLSREDLCERLRGQGVRQLGAVQRAYFEQDGNLTVFTHAQDAPPGLPIVPPWDIQPPPLLPPDLPHQGQAACLGCGEVRLLHGLPPACSCGSLKWTPATTDPLADSPSAHAGGSGPDTPDVDTPGGDASDGGKRSTLAGGTS